MNPIQPADLDGPAAERIRFILEDSFPPEELAPVDDLLMSCRKGERTFLVDDRTSPNGLMILLGVGPRIHYLEYFAVHHEARNRGLGAIALAALRDRSRSERGHLFEVETIGHGTSEAENTLRSRRYGFYQRGGAEKVESLDTLQVPAVDGNGQHLTLHMTPMWLPSAGPALDIGELRDAYTSILVTSYMLTGADAAAVLDAALR